MTDNFHPASRMFNNSSLATLGLLDHYLQDDPDNVEVILQKALILDGLNRAPEAMTSYSNVVTKLKKVPIYDDNTTDIIATALYKRGMLFDSMEDDDNALADFSYCIEILGKKPDTKVFSSDCHLRIANIFMDQNDSEAANEMIDRAIILNPHGSSPYILRGFLNLEEGNLDNAKADFQTACNLELTANQLGETSHSKRMPHDWQEIAMELRRLGGSLDPRSP